jgi:hypothetical protein
MNNLTSQCSCILGSIDKLNHEMTSYKTRHSSYGDPTGCIVGTRVKILEDLEAWALNSNSRKVYWMVGMAGTGKSTIAHTFCEILEGKNILGGSFFASRASDKTNNPRLIVPVIAYALAKASPSIKFEVIKAIEDDPTLAEPTYINLNEQFKKLIYSPIQKTTVDNARTYKIVVIDALDECINLTFVSSLITLILQSTPDIPLKIFIASRDETLIRNAFYPKHMLEVPNTFYLHEVEKDVVKGDIEKYIKKSLVNVQERRQLGQNLDAWPPQAELSTLIDLAGTLFIYAATTIRFIDDEDYRDRLSILTGPNSKSRSNLPTAEIDHLYRRILKQACKRKLPSEVNRMRETLAIIIFLRNPLPIQGISTLLERDISVSLSRLKSLVHVPSNEQAAVAIFHASFPDFITDPNRCSPKHCPLFPALVPSSCHGMLALKCLECMNRSLRYNLCDVPPESTVSRREATNLPHYIDKISEAVRYSCLYWVSHLGEVEVPAPELVEALEAFLHKHLLHWIECLSILGELRTGVKSLQTVTPILSVSGLPE